MGKRVEIRELRDMIKHSLVKGTSGLSDEKFREVMRSAHEKGAVKGLDVYKRIMKTIMKPRESIDSKDAVELHHAQAVMKQLGSFIKHEGLTTKRGEEISQSLAHPLNPKKISPIEEPSKKESAPAPTRDDLVARRARLQQLADFQASRAQSQAAQSSVMNVGPSGALKPETSVTRSSLATGNIQRAVSAGEAGKVVPPQTSVGPGKEDPLHLQDSSQTPQANKPAEEKAAPASPADEATAPPKNTDEEKGPDDNDDEPPSASDAIELPI